jgi:hypothetical protein
MGATIMSINECLHFINEAKLSKISGEMERLLMNFFKSLTTTNFPKSHPSTFLSVKE